MEKEKQIHTEVVDIDDLIQDDHNFNKGTEEGARLIERSFKDYGAGRSVLIDKNNRLVGGNKAQKGFKGAGFRKVVIVDSDADTLVAVRRKDVDLDSKEGRDMALLDNLTTQKNLAWDEVELQQVGANVEGFDIEDFGAAYAGVAVLRLRISTATEYKLVMLYELNTVGYAECNSVRHHALSVTTSHQ